MGICLCRGLVRRTPQLIDTPLRIVRNGKRHQPQSVACPRGMPASTEVLAVMHLRSAQASDCLLSLVEVRLHTGRMHQIRAHLASVHHPLVGDGVYGCESSSSSTTIQCSRMFLHCCCLITGRDD